MSPKRAHSISDFLVGSTKGTNEGVSRGGDDPSKHNYFCNSYDLTESSIVHQSLTRNNHKHYSEYVVSNKSQNYFVPLLFA
jgi:hypothetical protein